MFYWLIGMCTCCFLGVFQPFMELWVGESFLLPFSVVVLLCVYFYLYETTRLLNVFKDAGGVWHEDRFRPLISALVNLSLSLAAVKYIGIYGIVLSTIVALGMIEVPWLLRNIFTVMYDSSLFNDYFKMFVSWIVATVFSCASITVLTYKVTLSGWGAFAFFVVVSVLIPNIVFLLLMHRKEEFKLSISKDIEKEFKEVIGDRIAFICSSHNVTVDYAFQDINDIPGELPAGRTKPWGTGQAVLAAKKVIKNPFIVINADDYYGKEGFKAVHEYLVNGGKSCMAGFVLKNTLSDNGGVTRGICKMDDQNNLTEVVETKNIIKTADGAEADGVAVDVNSLVSMNMWGLTPEFLDVLEEGFKEFFEKEVPGNPLKAEYLIPIFIGELLEQGKMSVKVLKTNDTWYGMTYHEDVAAVKDSFKKMLENGVYKADLFSDL